jgi:leucyl aminopeptidase
MEFSTKVSRPESAKADAVVVGIHADGELTATAKQLDTASGGAIRAVIKSGDMAGKRGAQLLLRGLGNVAAPRVLLLGLGGKDDFGERAYADAVRGCAKAFGPGVKSVAVAAGDWSVKGRDLEWKARVLAIAAREAIFRSDELKSKREPDGNGLDAVALLIGQKSAAADRGLRHGTAIANGMELTKRLGNLPPNVCTPAFLGDEARKLARDWKLGVEVL